MAGQPGRSGGHNRKSVATHLVQGTYKPTRHGPLPAAVHPFPSAATPDWHPKASDVKALSARGRDWLAAAIAEFAFSAVEGQRLLEALRTLSRVELLEAAVAVEGITTEGAPHPLLGALAREKKVFLAEWAALRLERS